MDLSLDVCASVLGLEKCGLIPGVVPLELYKGELDFSDVCTSMNAMKSLRGAITTECVAVLPSRRMVKTVLAPFGFCVTSASAGI